MSKSTRDQLSYGRPYVDYYPMPTIPPHRGGYLVPDPHGSEPAFPKWTGASPEQYGNSDGAVAEDKAGKSVGTEGESKGTVETADDEENVVRRDESTIEVEVTEIEEEGDVVVVITSDRNAGSSVPVEQEWEWTPAAEKNAVRGDPDTSGSEQKSAVANEAGALLKDPESRGFKGPVCNPPHNP
ncbi:extracelular serine carboxypeptidase-like protein [Apiospora arundinis]